MMFARIGRYVSNLSKPVIDRIDRMVKGGRAKVVLFMKGSPAQPMCGFSKAVVDMLNDHKVFYETHDVLRDEQLRTDMKVYSDWPTFPQIYINGQFQGGYDILASMEKEGKLKSLLVENDVLDQDGNPNYK
ncbi:hypothetical protein ACOME3_001795 [Neoechinorhynchus agilis]